ncbi:MAG: hypothetical protein NT062_17330 [Proteobacteria bacterium]|nr:hypothetical protein [Pseudomonadota bacterium]
MRAWILVVATSLVGGAAQAQPVDPYGPPPPLTPPSGPTTTQPPPAPADPVLAEQVAEQVVARAQELYDAKLYLDAKQLAVEAAVTSPSGPAADHARMIIKLVNQQLGIRDDGPGAEQVDTAPITDPTLPPTVLPPVIEGGPHPDLVTSVHGGLFGGLLGAMIGTAVSSQPTKQAGGAVGFGIAGALGAALLAPRLVAKLGWNESQVRTVGSGTVWGGALGAFIGDIVTGLQGTSGRLILISASIGSIVGGLAGAGLASRDTLTRGDVALVDTFAGMGTMGGLTLGMIMQPAQTEAYSLNAAVGTVGGVLVGLVAAPQVEATPRRMLRVAGSAALGGAIPFLLYAGIHDPESSSDDQVIGLLSTGGLVFGAYLGFRYTKGMDEGLDTRTGKKPVVDDAPPAAVTRTSDGAWTIGTIAPRQLSRALDDRQHGTAFTLVGGAF